MKLSRTRGVRSHCVFKLPFGEELIAGTGGRTWGQGYTGDSTRQKFTSKERDNETGLDFFEARYYSSNLGRFTSVDPYDATVTAKEKDFREYLGQPQNWNHYAYVVGNPLIFIDPDGELWIGTNDRQNPYRWVDQCPEGGQCYVSVAAVVGQNGQTARVYGSRDANDITNYDANGHGMVDVSDMANHHDSQFQSVAEPANDPEAYLNVPNAVALFNVARMYHDAHPDDARLVFTGGSNENGQSARGANGLPIHQSHRNGANIDMRYIGTDGRPIQGTTAADNADTVRMASLWGAFRNQSAALGAVLTGNPQRFGFGPLSQGLQNEHRNHFHLQRTYPRPPTAGRNRR